MSALTQLIPIYPDFGLPWLAVDYRKDTSMPKVKDYVPMTLLLNELDQLDGLVQITPNQVSILLGISKNKLSERRGNGKAPPFVKEGGQYRYRVADVRNFLNGMPSIHPPRLPIEYKSYYPSGTRWLGGAHLIPWLNDN